MLAQYLPEETKKSAVNLKTKLCSAEIQTQYLPNGGLEIYTNLFVERLSSFLFNSHHLTNAFPAILSVVS